MKLPDWPRAYGLPSTTATIRSKSTDFDVTEILGFELDDSGEHDYVFIEKLDTNTHWVARQLADHAGIAVRDVGYSGLKDRRAITRQWFSIPRWNAPDWDTFEPDGVTVVQVGRHSRKLRRGSHRSNRFRILLRDIETEQSAGEMEHHLQALSRCGVPNYFGPQRFGRNGSNLGLADAWSSGKRLARDKRSIAISAARSFLFNESLAARIAADNWNVLLDGDTVNLDGSGSVFDVDVVDDELKSRCEVLDIHPAGLLFGVGADPAQVPPGHEQWTAALLDARVKAAQRSFRLRIQDLHWTIDDDLWVLEFELRRGAFATSVLREIALC